MSITNDSHSDEDIEMKVSMTSKALRNRHIHGQRAPTEGVVCVVAVDQRGRAKELLEEMAASHRAGWTTYGDGTYSITDVEAAKKFIEDNGGDVPFGFDS
jgi:acyl-CoA hydrolase